MRPILVAILLTLMLPAAADASSLKLSNGVLTYTDTVSTDLNAVSFAAAPDGRSIVVTESGKTSRNRAITITGDSNCPASGSTATCPLASVTSISVDTDGGNDTINQTTALPSKLVGGAGNDTITGGPGDDTFPEDAGADVLHGGDGHDTVTYQAATAPVVVSLDDQPGDGIAGENDNVGSDIEVVVGGSANDALTGSAADNELDGMAGDDTLSAGAGNDKLDGGPGNDTLSGGDGNDTLLGGADNDNLSGDSGDDTLLGGADNDNLSGDAGNDTVQGDAGDDTVSGGADNDTLQGDAGADNLAGGDGVDTATYADSAAGVRVVLDRKPGDGADGENDNVDTENVIGSGLDDVLIGNKDRNVLMGGTGNDRILGGKGADLLDGGSGDDILEALDGARDGVACGDGEDGVVTDRADVRTDCDYIKYRTVAASATALHLSKGYVRAPVRCSPAVATGCRGRLYLKVRGKVVGSLGFALTPGRRWVAKVKLTRAGLRKVHSGSPTTATLSVHDRQAIPTTQTIRIAR